MIRSVLLIAGLFICTLSRAQNIKSQSTFRLLQTANTLVDAQQLDAAEEFFKKGLLRAKSGKDYYCQAYAYQGLGNLYTKQDNTPKAVESYQAAIRLYKAQRMNVMASVVESLLKSVQGIGDLYAGIEIGAKGIKLSVIEVKLSKDRQYDYTLKTDTSINTDAASLSYQSEKETFDAVTIFWNMIKERYQIPAKRVYIVISSGLKQELDKYNKTDYFSFVIRPKGMDTSVKVAAVSAIQESELSMLGIVPQRDRYSTNQFDIGSGNTKGGYFDAARKFVPVTFPLGTKSFQRLVDAKTQGDINEFAKTAEKLWKDSIAVTIKWELDTKPDFKSRDIMYLSGGIVWAIASCMHPAEINKNYMEISSSDISEFRQRLINNYDELVHPAALKTISNSDEALAASKNLSRVIKTYDQRALLSGATVLDELIKQINTVNPGKKFIYPKYAYVGWISGYIIKKATQQYTGLVGQVAVR
jgi:tetratricopeptide (TPR) repeat protein